MASAIIAAIIAAIAGIASAGISAGVAKSGVNKQIEANDALADKQNEQNIENWERQNEYNSPENQMELFKRAGINPYLIAGKTAGSAAGAIAPAVGYQTDVTSPYRSAGEVVESFKDSVNWLLGAKLQQKQMQQTDANIAKTMQEIENLKTQQNLQQTENSLKLFDLNEMNPVTRERVQKEISNIVKRNLLLDLQMQGQQISNSASMYNLNYMLPIEYAQKGVDLQSSRYNLDYILPAEYEIKDASAANTRANTFLTYAKNTNQNIRNNFLGYYGSETPGQIGAGAGLIGFMMGKQAQDLKRGVGLSFNINERGIAHPYIDKKYNKQYNSVGGNW